MKVRRRHTAGFALVEAVVATAILGLIGSLVFGTFAQAMRGRDRAYAITSHYHQIRQAMLRMTREIQMAFVSSNKDCDDPRTATVFASRRSFGGARLDFTSFSHFKIYADANESDQNELSYFTDKHPDDPQRSVLMRREANRIDNEPKEGGVEEILAEDVVDLSFEFYDPKEDRWEDEWDTNSHNFRDDHGKPRLPMFVTIRLKVLGPDGEEEEFVTKTRLLLPKPLTAGIGLNFQPCWDE